jgi:general secretion pathway protein E
MTCMVMRLYTFLRWSLGYDYRSGKAVMSFFNSHGYHMLNGLRDQGTVSIDPVLSGEDGFLKFLGDSGTIDHLATQRVAMAIQGSGQPVDMILLELGLLEETRLADALAEYLGLERALASEFPQELLTDANIAPELLRRSNILPVGLNDTTITLAVARPLDDSTARAIGYFLDREPILKVGVGSELARHLANLLVSDGATSKEIDDGPGTHDLASGDVERLRDVASEAPIIRLLNRLVTAAVEQSASDIHIEPLEDHVRIRFRIDGALQVTEIIDRGLQLGLVSRVKILARLNIAEQRLPQDGRIRLAVRGRDIDFRVSTSPTHHGEGVVLRILDRKDVALDFMALGFDDAACAQLQRLISSPNGVILVTGPTGSGKTTSLYAALSVLNQPQSKIFTVEDPIEYHLRGVNQILVRPQIGLDFAAVLRSILRQDPDIIMVGEIRDSETARIAVQASLTGHLVLSTLHTNSAASSITRLRNIGIDNFLIISSVRAIVAQRLVRKLCTHCKKPHDDRFVPVGCKACNGTGYSGRTVIYEILDITDKIKQAILGEKPEAEIETLAKRDRMATLYESGMSKVRAGVTSMEEVLRSVAAPEL